MTTRSVIACDLGTGGIKAALFEADGACVAQHVVPCHTSHPAAGLHEQRPEDWWDGVVGAIGSLRALPGFDPARVGAICLSGHSLGCVPLDEDGALLQDAVPIWSDGRAVEQAAAFFETIDEAAWYRATGNGFPPALYTVFKMMWLRQHRPDVLRRARVIVGTKDFINLRLTGVLATDVSYASGLGAYDLRAGDYHDGFLQAAGFDRSLLPPIRRSDEALGPLRPEIADRLGLPRDVQVVCGGVDNSCMALGARTYREGDVFSAMGSSSWLTVASIAPLLDEAVRPYAFAHVVQSMFISATSIFSSGTSLDWVCRNLLGGQVAEGLGRYTALDALARQSPLGANGLLFVPTLGGGTLLEGGPGVRGALLGLDLKHGPADVVRATLEGVALALRVALDELRGMTSLRGEMIMVGGGAKSEFWRRIFAEVLDCTVLKTSVDRHAACLGAAALGFRGIGAWTNYSRLDAQHEVEDRIEPNPQSRGRVALMLAAYRKAAANQAAIAPALAELRALS